MKGWSVKTAVILSLLLTAPGAANAQILLSDFSSVNTLQDVSAAVNGSWHGDIIAANLFSPEHVQWIGANNLATDSGRAYSPTFTPVDLTGNGTILVNLMSHQPLQFDLTFFDTGGHSATARLLSPQRLDGSLNTVSTSASSFTGSVDWSAINQFEFAGINAGSEASFNLVLNTLSAVPEPSAIAIATGLGLLGFALFRGRFWQRHGSEPSRLA